MTNTKPVLTLGSLKNFQKRLYSNGFRRIHRSFLVNLTKVESMQKSKVQVAENWLPVGETHSKALEEFFITVFDSY